VKGDDTYEVQIDMANGKATKVDVAPNLWQAEATDRALDNRRASAKETEHRSAVDRVRDAIGSNTAKGHDDVKEAQQALKRQGFDPGPADGVMGAKTQQALHDFQKSKNLKTTGRLDDETAAALGINGKK
jgi:peptidoglycan hydrolase-like protein with peptidoglycan-binding domain